MDFDPSPLGFDVADMNLSDAVATANRTPSSEVVGPVSVCHVSMTLKTGGLERLLVDYSRFTSFSRFQPRFVALEQIGPPGEEILERGFPVDSLSFSETGKRSAVRRLATLLRDERIDIVHTHNTYAHFYGSIAARLAGVPVVVNTQHGLRCGDSWKHRLQTRLANRWTDRIVAVSDNAACLCRRVDPWSRSKIVRIWNGIDLSRFAYRGPNVAAGDCVAISVARLSAEKDFPTLLLAVSRVVAAEPTFRLLLVGDGPKRRELESLSDELNLRNHVEFLGERRDVPNLLERAGFFVSSSLVEGISLTLLEAAAVGLPIVATSVGGNPEIVRDGLTGRLVSPGDVVALSNAILETCRDRDAWSVMGELGRQRVEQDFNVRHMIGAYETLYSTLLQSRKVRSA